MPVYMLSIAGNVASIWTFLIQILVHNQYTGKYLAQY
jgi:hypothetical protein